MKTLNEEISLFKKLVKSKHGEVKPLIFEEIQINMAVITPEELVKFKESLKPIKDSACSANKKRCKTCIEMISNLENGKISNKKIKNCFSCQFGSKNYEQCEELKGKFIAILTDIQKEKGYNKEKGKGLQNFGQILGYLSTLRMVIQDMKNLFTKDQGKTDNP